MRNLVVILVLVNSFSLCYAEIDLIERTHHILAEYNGEVVGDPCSPSPNPLSYNFDNGIVYGDGWTEFTTWYDFDVYRTFAMTYRDHDVESVLHIESSISTTFKPLGNSYEIHTSLGGDHWVGNIQLTDLDDETTIYFWDYDSGIYPINPDHTYCLDIYTESTTITYDYPFISLAEVYFNVIPEPCTLPLLALGSLALKKRRKLPCPS